MLRASYAVRLVENDTNRLCIAAAALIKMQYLVGINNDDDEGWIDGLRANFINRGFLGCASVSRFLRNMGINSFVLGNFDSRWVKMPEIENEGR